MIFGVGIAILEPIYNFRTSITKDEAVQYLLGWFQIPLTITPNLLSEEEMHDQYLKDEEEYEPSWSEILQEIREGLVIDYETDKQEEVLVELKECDLLINNAHEYSCLIDDELAKGQESGLRVDPKTEHITIISFKEWSSEILETKPNESSVALRKKRNAIKERGMSRTKEANLLVKFALLIEVFAETGQRFKNGEKPNCNAIAKKIVERATSSKPPLNGVGLSSTEKALGKVIKEKNKM